MKYFQAKDKDLHRSAIIKHFLIEKNDRKVDLFLCYICCAYMGLSETACNKCNNAKKKEKKKNDDQHKLETVSNSII